MNSTRRKTTATTWLALLLVPAAASFAQDDREPGWYDRAELSFVGTDGNADATTFSFANKLERLWSDASFRFTASALRAESTNFARAATGSADQFQIVESSDSEVTAENYALGLRYDREINDRLYWHSGVDWVRNEFAGFDSRLVGIVGVGHRWWDDDSGHFRTDYGLTWTSQDDLIENPAIDDSWLGVRLSWDYERKFGQNATYGNLLVVDGNADESDDIRADMTNSLAVSMTEHLALKVSLRWLFDNLPALEEIPLIDGAGLPTGGVVFAEVEDLDTFLTVALVIDF